MLAVNASPQHPTPARGSGMRVSRRTTVFDESRLVPPSNRCGGREMTKVVVGITMSVDAYITGQDEALEHLGVRQSPFATFVDYRVKKAGGH